MNEEGGEGDDVIFKNLIGSGGKMGSEILSKNIEDSNDMDEELSLDEFKPIFS